MTQFETIIAVLIAQGTIALLILVGLHRRLRRVEERLAAPPPEPKDDGASAGFERIDGALGELSARLDRLAGLVELPERLARLEGREERRPDLSGLEAGMAELGAKAAVLERLPAIEISLSQALSREPERIDLAADLRSMLAETVESLDARLRSFTASLEKQRKETQNEMLARALGDRGFTEVIVVDATDDEGGRSRLIVEARRDGMSFKGPVLIEDGRVVEQKLRPSYPMFP
jgi:hypothetical protein